MHDFIELLKIITLSAHKSLLNVFYLQTKEYPYSWIEKMFNLLYKLHKKNRNIMIWWWILVNNHMNY